MSNEYLVIFLEEAQEHLQSLNDNVLKLESNPENITVVGEIFRSAHTFKGMSATMEFKDIVALTHDMENVLDLIRNRKMSVNGVVIDVIFECIDNLEKMVVDIQNGGKGTLNVSETINKLKKLQGQEPLKEVSKTADSVQSLLATDISASHEINVTLRHDCLLKSVRVIMVLDSLADIGEVISTNPSAEELDKEEFASDFTIYFLSNKENEDYAEIKKRILGISEIEEVSVKFLQIDENPIETSDELIQDIPTRNTQKSTTKIENKSIRVNLEKIEQLMNTFEETVIERGRIEEIVQSIDNPELAEHVQRLASISKDLQNLVLNMRMVPVETVFNRFPRMVRQLAKDLGKNIDLIITGADTEIDRIVIDEIGDPLVHLIRNSVDHGIETREARILAGKDQTGQVRLDAFHSGNHVVIEITDDGNGINKNKVLEKAIQKGIVTEAEGQKLSDTQIFELILEPGFSTADNISDISGRGVGLDVVKTTITKLGGNISVKSEETKGSTFRIELPLTLSIIQSMLVRTKDTRYAIPLGNIVETLRINKSDVQNIQGKDVMNYREKTVQIVSLSSIFELENKEEWDNRQHADTFHAVIVKSNERTYAIAVDEIYGQREIVLKGLGEFFSEGTAYFSGATILGDGKVVLILDCDKI